MHAFGVNILVKFRTMMMVDSRFANRKHHGQIAPSFKQLVRGHLKEPH